MKPSFPKFVMVMVESIGEIFSNTNNNKEGIQLRDKEEIKAKVR